MSRTLDIALAAGSALCTAPLLGTAALAIRLLDGAPVLFVQERVGQHRRPFRAFKLRTMRDNAVTPIGRLLRATGIDELPQLMNVLIGDMSLVGPRPLTRADIARMGWHRPRFDPRFSVRPGLTGLTQLQLSPYCDARVSWVLDRYYVQHASALLDLQVCAASALCLVLGKRSVGRWLRRRVRGRA
jgi:lipopolysaccharide/colanic/teichoic acid biosynthesis glycosyltransferase